MQRNVQDSLSYVIRTNGEFVPAMPDDGEFSAQEIRDYVAGQPEIACFTPDGYTLFQNSDATLNELPVNEAATSLRLAASDITDSIRGRVFWLIPRTFLPIGRVRTSRPIFTLVSRRLDWKVILPYWPHVLITLSLAGLAYVWLRAQQK